MFGLMGLLYGRFGPIAQACPMLHLESTYEIVVCIKIHRTSLFFFFFDTLLAQLFSLCSALEKNYRLEKPPNCSDAVYDVMFSCWATDPSARPSFTSLTSTAVDMFIAASPFPVCRGVCFFCVYFSLLYIHTLSCFDCVYFYRWLMGRLLLKM